MPYGDVYILRHTATVTTSISILQLAANSNQVIELISAMLTQRGSATTAQEAIALVRKATNNNSGNATVTAALSGTHLFALAGAAMPTALLNNSCTGVIATAEGTDAAILLKEGFNVLTGWKHLPVPEERFLVYPGTALAMKFIEAPASQTWLMSMTFRELG